MNVTREVVTDLLPIYFAGEAKGTRGCWSRIISSGSRLNGLRVMRRRRSKPAGRQAHRAQRRKGETAWRASFGITAAHVVKLAWPALTLAPLSFDFTHGLG